VRKETTICFRTTEEMRNELEREALREKRSVSSVIEIALSDYVERTLGQTREKRRFQRKAIRIPALTRFDDSDQRHDMTILDVSFSGLAILAGTEFTVELHRAGANPHFETVFAIPGNGEVKVIGKVERIVPAPGGLLIGATIADADFADYSRLQGFVTA
jgi:hypothetical protein